MPVPTLSPEGHTTQAAIDLGNDFERHESWFLSIPRAPWEPLPDMYNLE